MTPLAAAAAVAGVVAGSLAISGTLHGGHAATGAAAGHRHGVPLGGPAALRRIPAYYVDLAGPTMIMGGQRVQVRASTTGHVLATLRPPRPFGVFSWVSAAADDHSFILAAQRYWPIAPGSKGASAERHDNTTPTWFFRLTFTPSSRTARLTKLASVGTVGSSQLAGLALSPDGTKLALDLRQSIRVISLATGATRTWRWPGGGWVGNWKPYGQVLSWSADGKDVAFQQWSGGSPSVAHVRVLDTTAPGRSLSSARLVITFPAWTRSGSHVRDRGRRCCGATPRAAP
jgi:hypothetical protein